MTPDALLMTRPKLKFYVAWLISREFLNKICKLDDYIQTAKPDTMTVSLWTVARTANHKNRSPATAKNRSAASRNPHQRSLWLCGIDSPLPELGAYHQPQWRARRLISRIIKPYACSIKHYWRIIMASSFWDIPEGYLCPPIPDVPIISTIFAESTRANHSRQWFIIRRPCGQKIHALGYWDGASAIYPIIGSQSYGWRFYLKWHRPISVNTRSAYL